jgi:hypothetical protein
MRIAFLVIRNKYSANNVAEFIDAVQKYSINEIHEINPKSNGYFEFDLNNYDCICLHYSTISFPMRILRPFSESFRLRLTKFTGVKVAFVQDEQRALLDRIHFFNLIGLDHLFSSSLEENLQILYPATDCLFKTSSIMTSYVTPDRNMKKINIMNNRKWDLVYRGRKLPEWFGAIAVNKKEFGTNLITKLNSGKIKYNISSSESLRIYGKYWYHFLYLAKSGLLTPSGSHMIDMDGRYLEKWVKPEMPKLYIRDPLDLDNQVISPKLFEYAEWGALIISDNVITIDGFIAGQDYFLIDKDYSNLTSLVDILEDDTIRFSMIDSAREKLITSNDFSYEILLAHFDDTVSNFSNDTKSSCASNSIRSSIEFKTINFKWVILMRFIPTRVLNGTIWFVNNCMRAFNVLIRFLGSIR